MLSLCLGKRRSKLVTTKKSQKTVVKVLAGIQDISSKKCRIEMTKKIFQKPTSEVRLEKAGFTTQEIACIYELPFKLTSDVRLAMFQFKINHNILYTKSMLFRDRLAEDDKCYLCNLRQTLIHLFVECHYTKYFGLILHIGGIPRMMYRSAFGIAISYVPLNRKKDYFKASTTVY